LKRMQETDFKFIADDMVGKLAKWLRILGYDTLYFRKIDNRKLIDLALEENRILLTRDTDIAADKSIGNCILIADDNYLKQLRQVIDALGLSPSSWRGNVFSRCLICNEILEDVPKNDVRERVPEFVFKTQEKYKICPRCDRIYWGATHMRHVEETLKQLG